MSTQDNPDKTTNDNPDTVDPTRPDIGPNEPVEEATDTPAAGPDTGWPLPTPERPSGPHAPAIVLGIVCVVVAGLVLAQELGNLSVDWGDVGPLGIVAAGAVLVVFGLVGLLTSRRKPSEPSAP